MRFFQITEKNREQDHEVERPENKVERSTNNSRV